MTDRRPDPDRLLERLREQRESEARARLKIFFGASAGVGKTYAMLEEARERLDAGLEIVVGVVETHGRAETEALLEGLEILPRRVVEHRGTRLDEFDLDAALRRKPALVLVDELAHTNAPGSRHRKRWQDVEELLEAGISVYTTLNVQHVDSLNETVEQITGVRVRETVPDSFLDRADEVEVVDLPPDDLLQRLREGKVYLPEQAGRALDHFFKKGNLIALRELALRQTAERVDAQMERYRRTHAITEPWPVGGRLLVGVKEYRSALRLVRAARRMAAGFKAEWIVAHVEQPGRPRGESERTHLMDVLYLAEELGAGIEVLSGPSISDELIALARDRNAARIVVGKPGRAPWRARLFGSLVDALIRDSGEIDVYVIRGDPEQEGPERPVAAATRRRWPEHLQAVAAVIACTGIATLMRGRFDLSNLIMVYLLGVMAVAVLLGRGPAILASVLSVAAFDFFFVPPRFTFAVSDTQYLVTFGVMLLAAIVISTLAARMREQTDEARRRERRTRALYRLSRHLAAADGMAPLLDSIVRSVSEVVDARAAVLLPEPGGKVRVAAGDAGPFEGAEHERGVAQWVFRNGRPAGRGTATLPGATGLYLPLTGATGAVGVLGLAPANDMAALRPEQWQQLEASAQIAAVAIERMRLRSDAEGARLQIETERMRSTLLSAVSHDLRTPLAGITGAATTLLQAPALPEATRRELIESIGDEAQRLNRLVGNLLDMTRLESGGVELQQGWSSLEELVGAALQRLDALLVNRDVQVRMARDLPLVRLDEVLIQQVLFNLIENAVKHTPPGTPVEIEVRMSETVIDVEVADRGPGLAPGEEGRVFDKFYRARAPEQRGGAGLGLAICRSIVEAHGGRISAHNRPGGGASFTFTLPRGGEPPPVGPESGAVEC